MPILDSINGLPTAVIRIRMSAHDAHYGGNLVDGARMLAPVGTRLTSASVPSGSYHIR